MVKLTAPLIDLLDSKSKKNESKIFEKYIFKAMEFCLLKAGKMEKEKLKKEIEVLFSEDEKAWKKISDKFYKFDDDLYLEADFILTKEQEEIKSDYLKMMSAV